MIRITDIQNSYTHITQTLPETCIFDVSIQYDINSAALYSFVLS